MTDGNHSIGTLHWDACEACRFWEENTGVCIIDGNDWCRDGNDWCRFWEENTGVCIINDDDWEIRTDEDNVYCLSFGESELDPK